MSIIFYEEYLLLDTDLATGKVIAIEQGYRGGMDVKYEYTINRKTYITGGYIDSPYSNKDKFIGKYFPVHYSKKNHLTSEMLITIYQYKKYNTIYPDSLKWVLPLLY